MNTSIKSTKDATTESTAATADSVEVDADETSGGRVVSPVTTSKFFSSQSSTNSKQLMFNETLMVAKPNIPEYSLIEVTFVIGITNLSTSSLFSSPSWVMSSSINSM